MKTEIPCSGDFKNQNQKKDKENYTKRKQLKESVKSGHRKGRKSETVFVIISDVVSLSVKCYGFTY